MPIFRVTRPDFNLKTGHRYFDNIEVGDPDLDALVRRLNSEEVVIATKLKTRALPDGTIEIFGRQRIGLGRRGVAYIEEVPPGQLVEAAQ